MQQEEQQTDETYEQFEERVLNKRAAHMYHVIKNKLDTRDNLTLSEMTHKNSRKQVCRKLFSIPCRCERERIILNDVFLITGGAKVLHPAGPEEVPGPGAESRTLVRGHLRYQRPKVREPRALNARTHRAQHPRVVLFFVEFQRFTHTFRAYKALYIGEVFLFPRFLGTSARRFITYPTYIYITYHTTTSIYLQPLIKTSADDAYII